MSQENNTAVVMVRADSIVFSGQKTVAPLRAVAGIAKAHGTTVGAVRAQHRAADAGGLVALATGKAFKAEALAAGAVTLDRCVDRIGHIKFRAAAAAVCAVAAANGLGSNVDHDLLADGSEVVNAAGFAALLESLRVESRKLNKADKATPAAKAARLALDVASLICDTSKARYAASAAAARQALEASKA